MIASLLRTPLGAGLALLIAFAALAFQGDEPSTINATHDTGALYAGGLP